MNITNKTRTMKKTLVIFCLIIICGNVMQAQIPAFLKTIVKSGDIVITMGAGDIWKYGEEFLKQYSLK